MEEYCYIWNAMYSSDLRVKAMHETHSKFRRLRMLQSAFEAELESLANEADDCLQYISDRSGTLLAKCAPVAKSLRAKCAKMNTSMEMDVDKLKEMADFLTEHVKAPHMGGSSSPDMFMESMRICEQEFDRYPNRASPDTIMSTPDPESPRILRKRIASFKGRRSLKQSRHHNGRMNAASDDSDDACPSTGKRSRIWVAEIASEPQFPVQIMDDRQSLEIDEIAKLIEIANSAPRQRPPESTMEDYKVFLEMKRCAPYGTTPSDVLQTRAEWEESCRMVVKREPAEMQREYSDICDENDAADSYRGSSRASSVSTIGANNEIVVEELIEEEIHVFDPNAVAPTQIDQSFINVCEAKRCRHCEITGGPCIKHRRVLHDQNVANDTAPSAWAVGYSVRSNDCSIGFDAENIDPNYSSVFD